MFTQALSTNKSNFILQSVAFTPLFDTQIDRILSQRTSQLRITVEQGPSSSPIADVCGIFSRSSSEESSSPSSATEPDYPSFNNNGPVQPSLSDCSPRERGRLGVFNYERKHAKLDRHGSAPKGWADFGHFVWICMFNCSIFDHRLS